MNQNILNRSITINGRDIGHGEPPYIIAEMSGNHNGDITRAFKLISAAKDAGADAVKLQTYTADTITIDHNGDEFQVNGGLWDGRTLYELYEEAHTPWEWHADLFAHAKKIGITIFSSPFDPTAIELLETLDAPAYKIASFEIIDIPLIQKAAATGKPLIISTGMANSEEIQDAVDAAHNAGCEQLALLHCISSYPAPFADMHLRRIPKLQDQFGTLVGLSDHTLGATVPIAAVSLGAQIIEKHFTLSRADGGPDAAFSLEPHELKSVTIGCKDAWSALGSETIDQAESERSNMQFRRSLYVVEDIAKGALVTENNVRSIRPGLGLLPKETPNVMGKRAAKDIKRGTPLSWDILETSDS